VHFRDDQEIGYSRISGDFHNRPEPQIEGLAQVLSSIQPQKYVIAGFSGAEPAATLLCVSENGYTGLLDLCIGETFRRRGFAKALVLNEMAQALSRGDHRFWLQVETANHAARALYQGLGFSTVYDYIYYCR
jgi:ribosomal protein S18 acetylase RimI-like enzyme